MKELHFYIQGGMLLVALGCGLQSPLTPDTYWVAAYIQFFIGIYQYGMSWLLILKLRRKAPLLNIYFLLVKAYFIILLSFVLNDSFDDQRILVLFQVVPWMFSVFFLIVMEDLLWKRPFTNK